ncbi:MAG: hypothetical protein AAF330_06325, partial [Pseudomonadota bacterium]
IGMGLNLDVNHVAFSATSKFDGRRMRPLQPNELAQIAGRAGRHTNNGTYGVTGEAGPIPEEVVEAISENRFQPIKKLQWRNNTLDFASLRALIASLEERTGNDWLTRVRDGDDLTALKALSQDAEIVARATSPTAVRLLWEVCSIPDFRGISSTEHADLLGTIFKDLHQRGRIAHDWFARQVARTDRPAGNIDTLSKRLAYVRTWTYVAQRSGWLEDHDHWQGETRAVEDRLSDALHAALTQRFVDRRTSVLVRRLKQKERLVAEVNDVGDVIVEGEKLGRLEGFRFIQDKSATPSEAKAMRQVAVAALAPQFHLLSDRFYNSPDTELDFTEQGGLMWGSHAVGKLTRGPEPLRPQVQAFVDEEAGPDVAEKVTRRLQHFIDRKIAALFEPLLAMQRDEALTGLARGFAFQLVEAFGVVERVEVAADVKALDQESRGLLRKHGVRFGQFTIFLPMLLKPAATRLRIVLWSLTQGLDEFPEAPPPGLVTIPAPEGARRDAATKSGYRISGARAIRVDMLERLADMIRAQDTRTGFEANQDMLSITGLSLEQFAELLQGLGCQAVRGAREKVRAAERPAVDAQAAAETDETASEDPAGGVDIAGEPPALSLELAASSDETSPEPPAATMDVPAEPEVEIFYTFTWGPPQRQRPRQGGKPPRKETKQPPKAKGHPRKKTKPESGQRSKSFSSGPKREKAIDPDNPFAALAALKGKV